MVFSSLPASYLDPSNWQQQANPQPNTNTTASSQQLVVLPALPAAHGGAAIRPTPMAERARMANIPMQENAQKCPRCDSSNTKFCYYNNYNLSQPRHFCKTCRRYWTRGGALRNVPVGGGCRRNKRNKSSGSSSSKSTASTSTSTSTGTTASNSTNTSCGPTTLLGLTPQIPPLRFMTPLSQLGDHFIPGDLGLHYGGGISTPLLQQNHEVMHNFPLGISNISLGGGSGSTFFQAAGGVDSTPPWRFQPCQISSMAGLEGHGSGSMLFPFQGNNNNNNNNNMENINSVYSNDVRPKMGVKMEDNLQEMNLSSRQLMGINQGNDNHHHHHQHHHQYNYSAHHNWGNGGGSGTSNSWPDLSGFSSSSTTSNAL